MKLKKRYIAGILVVVIAVGIALFSIFKKREPSGPTPDEIVQELLEFDRNGDGQLSKDELSERMQGLFTRGDTNQDGILSHDELRKMAGAQSQAARPVENKEPGAGERPKQEAEK